ncbi:MAG: M56 family metallopeptidase [Candidatus Bathyarchaeia archaeon]
MSEQTEVVFTIDTELTQAYVPKLADFLYSEYLLPRRDHFMNVQRMESNNEHFVTFTFFDAKQRWHVNGEIKVGIPIQIRLTPQEKEVPAKVLNGLKEEIFVGLQFFEDRVRRATLYFAWSEGKEVVPEKSPLKRTRMLEKLLFENVIFLFIIFLVASIVLFLLLEPIFGVYVPIVLVAVQFVLILLGVELIARSGDWKVTAKNPNIHLLEYQMSPEELQKIKQTFNRDLLLKMKFEIYQQTLAVGKAVNCETAYEVFRKYGLECTPENMSTKTVNVYKLVKETVEKFNLPIPKIVVSNTVVPNAAATGISPQRGVIILTTGLLVQLNDDEIRMVLGHELSHLSGRDPLFLYSLVSTEYLLRFYVLWPIVAFFGFLYIIFALGLIYFIAKFFEAKCDLVSAMKLGQPKILAQALKKIGYRRLILERHKSVRFQDWIGWNPHPPIYFRIARLEKLEIPVKVRYPLLQSAKDCLKGFFATIT